MTVHIVPQQTAARYTVGSAAQRLFPIPFPFDEPSDVEVSVNGTPVLWTVEGGVNDTGIWLGSSARLLSAVALCEVAVVRATALRQDAVFPLAGAFRVAALNREVSRLWMALQDLFRRAGDVLARPAAEAADAPMLLPARAARANRFFAFDSNGQPVAVPAADQSAQTVTAAGTPTTRSMAAHLADRISVKMFGAAGDGITDDTAALQLALDSGRVLWLPRGIYNVTGLVVKHAESAVTGAGPFQSVLRNTTASNPTIKVNAGIHNTVLQDFRLTRSVPAQSGGHGVSFPAIHSQVVLENLTSDNNWCGFYLGGTDYSTVTNCIAEANWAAGFFLFNVGVVPAQWYGAKCIAQKNNGPGVEVRAQAGSGATQTTVGEWEGLQTFANGSYGFCAFGLPTVPVQGVRLRDCYLCADANSGLYLDTHGGYHTADGCFTELAGRDPTGRGLARPASGTGSGIEATVNNRDLTVSGGVFVGHSLSGIATGAASTVVNGSRLDDNGRSLVAGNRAGIAQTASAARVAATGCGMSAAGGASQLNAVSALDGRYVAVMGCDLTGNAGDPLVAAAFAANMTVVGCLPHEFPTLIPGAVAVGVPAGGALGAGSVNTAAGVLKGGAGYAHP